MLLWRIILSHMQYVRIIPPHLLVYNRVKSVSTHMMYSWCSSGTIVTLLYNIYILWGICAFLSCKIGEDILEIIEDYVPVEIIEDYVRCSLVLFFSCSYILWYVVGFLDRLTSLAWLYYSNIVTLKMIKKIINWRYWASIIDGDFV